MKFYGIDSKGYIKIQDATTISYGGAPDERRIYRDTVTEDIYIGTGGAFKTFVVAGQPLTSIFIAQGDLEWHRLEGLNTVPFSASTLTGSNAYSQTLPDTEAAKMSRFTDKWLKLSNAVAIGSVTAGIRIEYAADASDLSDITLVYDGGSPLTGIYPTNWQFSGGPYSSWTDDNNTYTGDPIATHSFVDAAVFATLNNATNPYLSIDALDQLFVRYSSADPIGVNESWTHWMLLTNDAIGDVVPSAPSSDLTASRYVYRKDEIYNSYVRIGPATGSVTENAPVTAGGGLYTSVGGNLGVPALLPDTVVVRDGSSNIYANILYGTATSAKYADLAEKYTCDLTLPVGTVVEVADDTEFEVVPVMFELSQSVVGVVSDSPAYLMNSDSEGLPIALTGKVPVRVVGEVRKGDFIVPAGDGLARKGELGESVAKIGVALKSDLQMVEKLVECIIK